MSNDVCSTPAATSGGAAPILTASVLWGTTGTASSLAPAGAPAAAIGSAGLFLGGLLLFLTGHWNPLRNTVIHRGYTARERRLLLLGALAVAGYPVTFYPAVARTGVAVATVVALCGAPIFAGALAWATGRSRPAARWLVATAAAVSGCVALVLGHQLTGGSTEIDLLGIGLAAVAGFVYVVYALVGGELITSGHDSARVMGVMFGAAGLFVLPVVLSTEAAWLLSARGLVVALHLAVFTTFLAYRLFGYGLRHTTVAAATTLTLAEPAVAAMLGVTVLGERLPFLSWCGLGILASGLVLLSLSPRTR
ncbi:EamA family transporter [Nocardia sp. NPDC050712]|uniref:EamA family transporter n=1 Tax=Nocardia sp. NPDC050712 TaxID=3155518 RepID=UPI003400ED24